MKVEKGYECLTLYAKGVRAEIHCLDLDEDKIAEIIEVANHYKPTKRKHGIIYWEGGRVDWVNHHLDLVKCNGGWNPGGELEELWSHYHVEDLESPMREWVANEEWGEIERYANVRWDESVGNWRDIDTGGFVSAEDVQERIYDYWETM